MKVYSTITTDETVLPLVVKPSVRASSFCSET